MSTKLYNQTLTMLAKNPKLCKLLAFVVQANTSDDIPLLYDKLLVNPERLVGGERVTITWASPYCIEEGYLFMLPGLTDDEPLNAAIVHIPQSARVEDQQQWFVLKHLLVFAEQIEIHSNY